MGLWESFQRFYSTRVSHSPGCDGVEQVVGGTWRRAVLGAYNRSDADVELKVVCIYGVPTDGDRHGIRDKIQRPDCADQLQLSGPYRAQFGCVSARA